MKGVHLLQLSIIQMKALFKNQLFDIVTNKEYFQSILVPLILGFFIWWIRVHTFFFNPQLSTWQLILDRGERRQRDREKTSISCLLHMPQPGTDRNLSMCPDHESHPQPFGLQDDAPTKWAHWPGCGTCFFQLIYQFNLKQKNNLFVIVLGVTHNT